MIYFRKIYVLNFVSKRHHLTTMQYYDLNPIIRVESIDVSLVSANKIAAKELCYQILIVVWEINGIICSVIKHSCENCIVSKFFTCMIKVTIVNVRGFL